MNLEKKSRRLTKTRTITFRVDKETYARINAAAKHSGMFIAEYVRLSTLKTTASKEKRSK